jgi:hypothetical protein
MRAAQEPARSQEGDPRGGRLHAHRRLLILRDNILRDDVPYRDLGAEYFLRCDKTKPARHLVRRLLDLGLQVEIRPAA